MEDTRQLWAIVLAAGEGRRLRSMAASESQLPIPKQYRVLDGRESMLRWAIRRAAAHVPKSRLMVIVAPDHRVWWETQLADLPTDNVVIQPRNKGTAAGVLLPLLTVLERDPRADVLVLPSDHYIDREEPFRHVLSEALGSARRSETQVVLLGVSPSHDRTDYGWIVPGDRFGGGPSRAVRAFEEKPDREALDELLARGAVVNSLILAAPGQALLRLFAETAPLLVEGFGRCIGNGPSTQRCLDRLYGAIESLDFSRQVLEPMPERLLVHPVPAGCGWTDLGTPERLRTYLEAARPRRRTAPRSDRSPAPSMPAAALPPPEIAASESAGAT